MWETTQVAIALKIKTIEHNNKWEAVNLFIYRKRTINKNAILSIVPQSVF